MKTINNAILKLKDGRLFKPGKEFIVMPSKKITHAICQPVPSGDPFAVPYARIVNYFKEFHLITQMEIQNSLTTNICPSITGQMINLDGFDDLGFPSWWHIIGLTGETFKKN